jgi:hypothetical protein
MWRFPHTYRPVASIIQPLPRDVTCPAQAQALGRSSPGGNEFFVAVTVG